MSSLQIQVRSVDEDIELMSTQAALAGLFPPKDAYGCNSSATWRHTPPIPLIPVHTTTRDMDNVSIFLL
jgi:hypothetical protein